jgi:hypothetical protein
MVKPKCAECQCVVDVCMDVCLEDCIFCTKETCCCISVHKPKNNRTSNNSLLTFLRNTKTLFAAALGIEILCISAAVFGENSAFYFFGYILGFAAAGFTTFITIVGRYDFTNAKIDSCCSVLEQQSGKGFLSNLIMTLKNFGIGLSKLPYLHSKPNLKQILKTSLIILVTAESACILTAKTIDLIFYKHSIFLSIPLALLAGSFTVVVPEAYKKMKHSPTAYSNC